MPIPFGKFQIPVDVRPGYITFVRIYESPSGTEFVRAVVTNSTNISSLSMSSGTEYWYTLSSVDVTSFPSIVVAIDTEERDASAVSNFIQNYTAAFNCEQEPSSGWTSGTYTPASGSPTRLFKTTDPDDTSKKIGILVEQDTNNELTNIVFYKTCDPSNGLLYQETVPESPWTEVLDGSNNSSTNPEDIDSNSSWYYFASA